MSQATGRAVLALAQTSSTNSVARDLARRGTFDVVVLADHQTEGRGRAGRVWQAPPGCNVLMSMVMRPAIAPAHAPRAVLVWAGAIAEALDLRVKWPNDLVTADGRKVGGMLAELHATAQGLAWIVLGVGINANQRSFPPELGQATSLALLRGDDVDREAVATAVIRAVDSADPEGSLDGWRRRAITLGQRVRVAGREGVAQDVRDDGALLVDGHPVLAGDVEMVGVA